MTVSAADSGTILIEQGWYCPEFGLQHTCTVLVLKYRRATLPMKTGWVFDLTAQ